jgi:hypothetical protein
MDPDLHIRILTYWIRIWLLAPDPGPLIFQFKAQRLSSHEEEEIENFDGLIAEVLRHFSPLFFP